MIKRTFVVCTFASILVTAIACQHKAMATSVPTGGPSAADLASMQPDQVNTSNWDKAWTNLLNDAEQSFRPALPRLVAVEVELVVGNPGATEDELTLAVMDPNGQTIAMLTQDVPVAKSDHTMFLISKDGMEVSPGERYRLKLSGGATFGWKYVVGGYENGEATFNGKPLLPDARSTFLFRTFGPK